MLEPDRLETHRTFHISYCSSCNQKNAVPLSETALERRPWRVVWRCSSCEEMTAASVPPQIVDDLLALDRAGGMRISIREVKAFDITTVAEFNRAVIDEL